MHRRLPTCLATCILTLLAVAPAGAEVLSTPVGKTEFSTYRDLAPPIVRLADDLSQGWLMAQVEVAGTQRTAAGEETFRSVWAWVELFERDEDGTWSGAAIERDEDGTWLWVGNVSNAQPPEE